MLHKPRTAACFAGIAAICLLAPAQALDMNKSIRIGDGAQAGSQSTVNGSITVGSGATIDGSLQTVNGTIRIGENTRLEDAETVNGSIRVASGVSAGEFSSVNGSVEVEQNVTVDDEISVVNGKISLGRGTTVAGDVSNVNGEITLEGADVGGDLATVNGDVSLHEGAVVRGNLVIEKPGGWGRNIGKRKPRVVIGGSSRVMGEIRLEREVDLYISDAAVIGGVSGVMSTGDAVRFSGERP